MYWIVLLCGWALTAAAVTLVWITGKPGRSLGAALSIGIVAGLMWPVTLWVAIGSFLVRRTAKRAGGTGETPEALETKARQAEAYARQATLEGMPTSADYWNSEAQRLDAQLRSTRLAAGPKAPAVLAVLGCTVASVATIAAIALTWPLTPQGGPVALQTTPTAGPAPAPATSAPRPLPTASPSTPVVASTTPPPTVQGSRVPEDLIGHWRGPASNGSRTYLIDITVDQGDWSDEVTRVTTQYPGQDICTYNGILQMSGPTWIEYYLELIPSANRSCSEDTQTRRLDFAPADTEHVTYSVSGDFRGTLERYS